LFLTANDKESALIYYKRAVDIDPTNNLATRQLAQTYYDVGEKEMSLTIYEGAIAKETDNNLKADLYYNLGVLNMQLGDYQQAEDNFSMAYEYNPDDIDALRGIAQTFENAEKWRRAEYFYRKLIDIEPENPQHYRAMARVLLRQGDTVEAQEYFDRSKEL
jgi:tetratricopeptide (TPR) repeat protein